MDEIVKQQKEIIKLVGSLLERDDFKEWLKDAENLDVKLGDYDVFSMSSLIDPYKGNFNRSLDNVCYSLGQELQKVAYHQKMMWRTYNDFINLCENYLKDEKDIKQPDLLKFIAGYKEWKEKNAKE